MPHKKQNTHLPHKMRVWKYNFIITLLALVFLSRTQTFPIIHNDYTITTNLQLPYTFQWHDVAFIVFVSMTHYDINKFQLSTKWCSIANFLFLESDLTITCAIILSLLTQPQSYNDDLRGMSVTQISLCINLMLITKLFTLAKTK